MGPADASTREAQSFERLRSRLAAISDVVQPPLDPRSVALRALVVVDSLSQPDIRKKLSLAERGGADLHCLDELREAARALLHAASNVEPPSASRSGERVTEAVRDEAHVLRVEMFQAVEQHLLDNDDARLWLEVIRQSKDDVDLMFDLRSLAGLYRANVAVFPVDENVHVTLERADQLADALQAALSIPSQHGQWNDWQARAWTLTAALFDEVCRIARFALHGVAGLRIPSLPMIARSQRHLKAAPPARTSGPAARTSRGPSVSPSLSEEALHVQVPRPPALPANMPPFGDALSAPIAVAEFSAPTAADFAVLEPIRTAPRFNVELQVSIFSESNLYVGFSENLSVAGIFVATHVLRPIGATVEVSVLFPGRLEPVRLSGVVRWIREVSATSDGWPGMGIQFDGLTDEQQLLMQAFLSTRDPLFFDE